MYQSLARCHYTNVILTIDFRVSAVVSRLLEFYDEDCAYSVLRVFVVTCVTCVTDNSDNVSYTSVLLLIESKRIAEVNAGTAKMVKTTIRIFLSDILQIYIYIYIFTVYFWRLRTLLYSTVLYFNAPEVFYVLIVDSSSVNKRRLILSIYDI